MQILTAKQIEKLESVIAKLEGLHGEFTALAKKSSDGTINKFKAGILNQVLASANDLLGAKYLPIAGFSQLDLDALPTNSDATMVISQYLGAIEVFRCAHIIQRTGNYFYVCSESHLQIRTAPPKKLKL